MPDEPPRPPTIPAPPTPAERDQISREQGMISDEWADGEPAAPPEPAPETPPGA